MRRRVPILIMMIFVLWSKGRSTPPIPEPFLDAPNPTHYHQLVSLSIIPDLFQGCLLVDSGVPKYFKSQPERIHLKQIYSVPSHRSSFGVNYRLNVTIIIDGDTITGMSELSDTWTNYAEHISMFENNLAVNKFLQIAKPNAMNFNGRQIYSDAIGLSRVGYNVDSGAFYFLFFKQVELIRNICLFLPKLDSLAWFSEFQSKCGIGRLHLENNKLRISQSRNCPTCTNNVLFHYSRSRLMEINLSTNQSWEYFPMVRYALLTVENRLVGDTLGSCEIGSGRGHVYLKLTRRLFDDTWFTRVAIKCQELPKLRDICFRVRADSTIDRFHVCFES